MVPDSLRRRCHIFGRICTDNGIKHKLTKPYHPWTNGQAERMNRTIKDATLKVFHYPDLESLKAHVLAFVDDLQLRQAPQGAAVENAVRSHRARLDKRPVNLQDQPAPPHPGTTHLTQAAATRRCRGRKEGELVLEAVTNAPDGG